MFMYLLNHNAYYGITLRLNHSKEGKGTYAYISVEALVKY